MWGVCDIIIIIMENNYAFIDGQNLYMATTKNQLDPWSINLKRFRVFLREKYKVENAYYFLGYLDENNQNLYESIQSAGFILMFREHNSKIIGKKKGNVDSDIIFFIMQKLYFREDFNKVVLVSGDGDYKKLVDFLIKENKFKKILFPNSKGSSSLYKSLGANYFAGLDNVDTKLKISSNNNVKNEKGSLGN